MKCRNCNSDTLRDVINLGTAPASNAYLREDELNMTEGYTPLKVVICTNCKLVQTEDYFRSEELFTPEYAYLSSASKGWLKHCETFCSIISDELCLSEKSLICEVASNDGYLLTNFIEKGFPCFGIEPTMSAAKIAQSKGVDTIVEFLGRETSLKIAAERGKCDLIICNNVYAHVPDLRDFTDGLFNLLSESGTITLEFPHVLSLLKNSQFDTIYHEHFSYHSLLTCMDIFKRSELEVYHAEKIPTHGGSLRLYVQHLGGGQKQSNSLKAILDEEIEFGLGEVDTYLGLEDDAQRIRNDLRVALSEIRRQGGDVVAYGAAAKGNTLLNYCGITERDVNRVYDKSSLKIGKFLPGSRIPVLDANEIKNTSATHILILPWNIRDEILNQFAAWGIRKKKIITAIPEVLIDEI